MASLTMHAVSKSFGAVKVLSDINLDLNAGEFVVFVGPSGCGKSTLLRLIAGLEDISSGDLLIEGERMNDVLPAKRGIAMVFQSYALYPHMSVYENMAFGLEQARLDKDDIAQRVNDTAKMLQIENLLERKPRQLSGGQRQRVAIGRAITRRPRIFLFDEPLSNLDAALRVDMRLELARLHNQLAGTTMIYVTHDQVEAMTLADRIVVLNQGHIEQIGTPIELYEKPASRFVAGFIGSPRMNFIETPLAATYGAHSLGVRPEHISLSSEAGEWRGAITLVEQLGSDTYVHIDTELAGTLTVRIGGNRQYSEGDTIFATPESGALHLFDETGKPLAAASTAA